MWAIPFSGRPRSFADFLVEICDLRVCDIQFPHLSIVAMQKRILFEYTQSNSIYYVLLLSNVASMPCQHFVRQYFPDESFGNLLHRCVDIQMTDVLPSHKLINVTL